MHTFSELIDRCAIFTLEALKEVEANTTDALQTSGAASLVKTLQMISLEKSILAVGIFSIFEAILQDRLNCSNGFKEAKNILNQNGESVLLNRFTDLELAINALKHGRGKSYNALLAREVGKMNSNIKQPDDNFFDEGHICEITSLIKVDDKFIYSCVEVINQVSHVIEKNKPEVFL